MPKPYNPEHQNRMDAAETEVLRLIAPLIAKTWQMAIFQIDVSRTTRDEPPTITHRLWNPMTDEEVYDFSDAIFLAVEVLNALLTQNKQHWKRGLFIHEMVVGRREIRTNYLFVEPTRGSGWPSH